MNTVVSEYNCFYYGEHCNSFAVTYSLNEKLKCIKADPGFLTGALEHIQANIENSTYTPICSLLLDEMAICARSCWDSQRYACVGFVTDDIGKKSGKLATSALTFMLVGIDKKWRLPIAYYPIDGFNGGELSVSSKILKRGPNCLIKRSCVF